MTNIPGGWGYFGQSSEMLHNQDFHSPVVLYYSHLYPDPGKEKMTKLLLSPLSDIRETFLLHTQNICLIGEKLIIIILGGYIFLCLSPFFR